jgi:hypothetical protein
MDDIPVPQSLSRRDCLDCLFGGSFSALTKGVNYLHLLDSKLPITRVGHPFNVDSHYLRCEALSKGLVTYFGSRDIGAIEVADFSVVDNVAAPYGVCSRRPSSVTLVVTTIDLLGRQAQAS